MRIEFHLGTYKTGSTSIQNRLFSNRDALQGMGILFPETGLLRDFRLGHRHKRFIMAPSHSLPDLTRKLIREIEASGADRVVLSNEAWSNPRYFSRLNILLGLLEDNNINDFHGVLSLRNRARSMVSYYREFTFHHKNRLDFREYVESCHAMFDQHLMVQSFQAMLDGRLTLISFDKHDDIFPVYCKAAGIAEAIGTAVVERGNVKSADALDVEALRLARVLGLPPERLPEVLPEFREKHDGKDALWTERYPDDIPATSANSEARFCRISGWSPSDVAALFHVEPPKGRCVAEVGGALTDFLRRSLR